MKIIIEIKQISFTSTVREETEYLSPQLALRKQIKVPAAITKDYNIAANLHKAALVGQVAMAKV